MLGEKCVKNFDHYLSYDIVDLIMLQEKCKGSKILNSLKRWPWKLLRASSILSKLFKNYNLAFLIRETAQSNNSVFVVLELEWLVSENEEQTVFYLIDLNKIRIFRKVIVNVPLLYPKQLFK